MTTTIRTIAATILTLIVLGLIGFAAGSTSADPVFAPTTCVDAHEFMPAGACGVPASDTRDELVECSPAVVAAAFADLWRGNYDGILSTCAGVDEDSPIVDAILTAVGR